MSEDPVDVLIIGAGASGAAMAWSLVDTRMKILCMEQGDWMNPADYPSTRRNWELTGLSIDPNVRGLVTDYPINGKDSPISVVNFNGVGGSTILYAAHFPRFHPSDFKVKTLDGVADDWPIDYDQLEPYFAENDRMMGVAGLVGDPAYPPKEPPLPPVPIGRVGETLGRGFNKLGWHWWPSDSAIATVPHERRDKCINLGPCIAGCAQGAKGSTDVTYWPVAIRGGVELRTRCRVREILVDDRGMASGVIYYDADGAERRQKAEVVVLACNGVGTPRLLLNSRSSLFPDGLANSSGLVGKNLMFHPYAWVQGIFDDPLDGYKGPGGCCIWSQEFYETDTTRGFVRGYTMEITRGMGPVTTALSGMAAGRIPWGPDHHRAYLELFNRRAGMVMICEDLPEAHNTVTLDRELVDSDGIPAPKVSYQVGENSRKMLDHAMARGSEVLQAAGAKQVDSHAPMPTAGWHLMGTARMGTDPKTSVVNEWGRCHDVRNLFIVDGSIFVTSAGVNPTCTIQALALYIADSMKKNLANLFD
ncbi:MAG: GMC family oxidoreductase [Pseudomonadales bacterium]|nr:GMC family oxidoreductase [Pseudomonadales bacterium]MDP7593980.1 GMC family oxidoreductase [Pseudomonadales bacterium]HJN48864.1 GMC family oxidoreductase [Pseudomonadales bacterium]